MNETAIGTGAFARPSSPCTRPGVEVGSGHWSRGTGIRGAHRVWNTHACHQRRRRPHTCSVGRIRDRRRFRGLVSFGIAGGLAPGLRPGTCLVGSTIITETATFTTDWNWSRNLLRLVPGAVHGAIVGLSPPVVAHPDAKRALHLRTGALAVDNKSHVVARIAADRALPMVAVRVVLDPANRGLPKSAVDAMQPDGTIDLAVLVRELLSDPNEVPMLLRIAVDAVVGFAALVRRRSLLGPGLGLPGLQAERHPAPPAGRGTDIPPIDDLRV